MKRLVLFVAVCVAAVIVAVPAASASSTSSASSASSASASGGWLGIGAGKSAIRGYLSDLWLNGTTGRAMKIDLCWKPQNNRVRCFWQTREHDAGGWYQCYGNAKASRQYGGVYVTLSPYNWPSKCYYSDSPAFM